jgi:hypothetical protein
MVWVCTGSFRGVCDQPVTGHDGSIPAGVRHFRRVFACTFCDYAARLAARSHFSWGSRAGSSGWGRDRSRHQPTPRPINRHLAPALGYDGPPAAPPRWVRTLAWLKDHLRGTPAHRDGRCDDQDGAAGPGPAVARPQCGRRRPAPPVRGAASAVHQHLAAGEFDESDIGGSLLPVARRPR